MKRKEEIKGFLEQQKMLLIFTLFTVVLCYFKHAMSTNVGIDTEQYIMGAYGVYYG